MGKREQRTERRRQQIAERRGRTKTAIVEQEIDRAIENNRWILWAANAIPFAVLVVGYGLLYLVANPKEMGLMEQLTYIGIIAGCSAIALGMRPKVIAFLLEFVEHRK